MREFQGSSRHCSSVGSGQEHGETLDWDTPAERFARAAVEFVGDCRQVVGSVVGQVAALGEVLGK